MPLVVPREVWDAVPARGRVLLKHPVKNVVFHHFPPGNGECRSFDTCAKTIREMQIHHMEKLQMEDIAYNFIISGDAMAWEGRGWEYEPEPSLKYPQYNGKRIDIAYVGPFGKSDRFSLLFNKAMEVVNFGLNFRLICDNYKLIDRKASSEMKSTGYGHADETTIDDCRGDFKGQWNKGFEGMGAGDVMNMGDGSYMGRDAEEALAGLDRLAPVGDNSFVGMRGGVIVETSDEHRMAMEKDALAEISRMSPRGKLEENDTETAE